MADRYWVGGTDTWDATAGIKWALTSGGLGGEAVPTSADVVFFDAASGANTVTLGSGYNPECLALTMTGFTGTLDFNSQKIFLTGNARVIYTGATTFSVAGTPVIDCTYSGASGTRTVSPTFTTEANSISFNVTAGSDSFTVTTGQAVKNLDFTGFSGTSGANTRNIYGNLTISSGMTLGAGVSNTSFIATSGTQQITTNGKTLDFPVVKSGAGSLQLQDNLTMGSTRLFTLTAGTLDLTGNSGNWTLSCGSFNSSNSNIRSISFGTGNITVVNNSTTVFTVGNSTNLTISGTPTVNATYSGSTGTRTVNAGNVGETFAIRLNVTNGSDAFSLATNATGYFNNINFTGFSGALTLANPIFLYGNLIVSSGMTLNAGTNSVTFAATSGTQQITTNGKTLDFPLVFDGIGGTFSFQDSLTQGANKAFTITNGIVRLKNSVTSTVGNFGTGGSNQKFLQSTTPGTQATLSQASGTVNVNNLTIRDINATGGATWNAFTTDGNVDAGNNTGWDFFAQLGKYIYTRRKNKRILL